MPGRCNVAMENGNRNNAEIAWWTPRKVVRKFLEGIELL